MPGGTEAKETIGAGTVDNRSRQTALARKTTLIRDAILLVESQRPVQMHHTEELSTLDLTKVSLTHREGNALELVLHLHLKL